MKTKFIKFYMKIAEETALLSSATRLKVGCIAVKDDKIISFGYNGTPSGWDNNCEYILDGQLKTKNEVIAQAVFSTSSAILTTSRDCFEARLAIPDMTISIMVTKHAHKNNFLLREKTILKAPKKVIFSA